jgi:hypothetical protein
MLYSFYVVLSSRPNDCSSSTAGATFMLIVLRSYWLLSANHTDVSACIIAHPCMPLTLCVATLCPIYNASASSSFSLASPPRAYVTTISRSRCGLVRLPAHAHTLRYLPQLGMQRMTVHVSQHSATTSLRKPSTTLRPSGKQNLNMKA